MIRSIAFIRPSFHKALRLVPGSRIQAKPGLGVRVGCNTNLRKLSFFLSIKPWLFPNSLKPHLFPSFLLSSLFIRSWLFPNSLKSHHHLPSFLPSLLLKMTPDEVATLVGVGESYYGSLVNLIGTCAMYGALSYYDD